MQRKGRGNRDAKQALLKRRRRIIFNNDGGDAVKAENLADPADFLDIRTTPLRGSHVDTVSYCSGIFGLCNHDTAVGERKDNPVISGLIARGSDPLAAMTGYCRRNGVEIFCSLRMNDTHDATRPDRFECNRFKQRHPDCLLGKKGDRFACGQWSAVNYARREVREQALRFIAEICRKYDLDGLELDFFRHPVFFRQTTQGMPVGDRERGLMTGLIGEIAALADREGKRRGRPFLVAARTPDDIDYCAAIGLEIERWMGEGLIDIFIPGGYFRLNRWEYSVGLGHRHGVMVYPGLSESRVGGGHHRDSRRSSDECYRARAAGAWQAGADGVYVFNLFDPHRRAWREMGDPAALKGLDKIYFASVRGVGSVAGGAYPHGHFISIPSLNPGAPIDLAAGERTVLKIMTGDESAAAGRKEPEIILEVEIDPARGRAPVVILNGHRLSAAGQGARLRHRVPPALVRPGTNTAEIAAGPEKVGLRLTDAALIFNYSGKIFSDARYLERTRRNM